MPQLVEVLKQTAKKEVKESFRIDSWTAQESITRFVSGNVLIVKSGPCLDFGRTFTFFLIKPKKEV